MATRDWSPTEASLFWLGWGLGSTVLELTADSQAFWSIESQNFAQYLVCMLSEQRPGCCSHRWIPPASPLRRGPTGYPNVTLAVMARR